MRPVPALGSQNVGSRFSARHNTIRARVATVAGTSALFTSARNSAHSSTVSSIRQVDHNVNQTASRDTRRLYSLGPEPISPLRTSGSSGVFIATVRINIRQIYHVAA